jgi:predicted PurR-regulated permease PerM
MSPRTRDPSGGLIRSALQLLALGLLIAGSLWILRPFLIAGLWATMLSVALWPLLLSAHAAFGGRRAPAVTLLTGALLLIVVLPLYFGVSALAANAEDLAGWVQSVRFWTLPQPPEWIANLPLVGSHLAGQWRELADAGPQQLAARIGPHARELARWLVREMGGLGALVLQFLLTTIFVAILLARGERAAGGLRSFARRLAGLQGERATLLAAQAIRAVALGVVLTAIVQSVLVGVGFAVVGVPFPAILTALSFMLSVAQIGPLPLLIGAVIWVYAQQGGAWGSAYLVWALLCATIDNVMRPVLIKRGADLPLLLIFAGVIGGLFAFGIIGLFIGPVVLAVGYMLLLDWMDEARDPTQSVGAPRASSSREGDADAAQPDWH